MIFGNTYCVDGVLIRIDLCCLDTKKEGSVPV